jgi:5-methylcytosine-specific restriction endonuclease McrA
MWTIPKPEISAREAFDTCIEGIRDVGKKMRLEGIRQQIENAEADFDLKASATELYLIAEATEITGTAGNVSVKEMEQLYDSHMARQKSRGHNIYDKIMMAAVHGQCPFCGHLPVSTLDHSLPKARHPTLAVTPINLLPCCKDCNHNKGTAGPDASETQFLHAYYDDLTADRWLYAQIVQGSPPGATFFVEAPNDWGAAISARVRRHFTELKLSKLYASQAGRQLQKIRKALSSIYDAAGADAVREDLRKRSESCGEVSVNSWEGALYEAASESDWYCDGGFRA